MTLTVAEIKKKYPNPRSTKYPILNRNSYCVGGAVFKFLGKDDGDMQFPSYLELAMLLEEHGIKKPCRRACKRLINLNDSGDFDSAWEELRKILEGN